MKQKNYLESLYNKNPKTDKFIIDITLNSYEDVFNDLDSAPFKRRDINPDLKDFIDNCSYDIPLKYGVDLCFHITRETRDARKETLICKGLKTYNSFSLNTNNKLLHDAYKHIIFYVLASFLFLFLGFSLEDKLGKGVFYNTILEGLNIGGWVFLWEAISFLFFNQRKSISDDIKKYKRLLYASIYFKYDNPSCE